MSSLVDDLVDQMLRRDEAVRAKAYPDPLTGGAPWTIGIGHTGPEVHEGLLWDDFEIDAAFQLDKAAAWQACVDHFPWFESMSPARQAVVWCMSFQMGITRLLGFHDTLAAMGRGDYTAAANGMRASVWAHQTPLRAIRLAEQFETGVFHGA
jgi:lysozyme